MIQKLLKLIKDEAGATAIEYGLLAALVAVSGIFGFEQLGSSLIGFMDYTSGALEEAASN